ncbi:MAG: hypothetical protein UT33_C0010G0035 [Candidatus Peregrinibacteria bacterium GW2011_GWC2_39_14]|nr:MAG: hypothetical protein US92_C0006G0035 [Candidatus Peregrinibacteria bacterium GW2011_GWA2_38_36]KKR05892.1 MAG: hypothetical protein UT33_C0010G0035 [Candidatus Peregrinibacteria bacterium GW2011_GWC2_39_14]
MDIEFFESSRGDCPIKNFLLSISAKRGAKITLRLERIEKYTILQSLNAGILEKMAGYEKYNLYEFKTRFQNTQYRIICHLHNAKLVLLHGFIKKSPKIPQKEINTAIGRIKLI